MWIRIEGEVRGSGRRWGGETVIRLFYKKKSIFNLKITITITTKKELIKSQMDDMYSYPIHGKQGKKFLTFSSNTALFPNKTALFNLRYL